MKASEQIKAILVDLESELARVEKDALGNSERRRAARRGYRNGLKYAIDRVKTITQEATNS